MESVPRAMQHVREALAIFRRDPRLWRYAWGPLLGALALFVVLVAVTFWLFDTWVRGATRSFSFGPGARVLADAGFAIVLYFAGTAAYLALAALLGSFGWERLTEEIERHITGVEARQSVGCLANLGDPVSRLVFTFGMAMGGLCCGFVVPVVGGALIAGILGLFDFTANAFLRRGVTLAGQFGRVFRLSGWPSFVVVSGLLTLVPVVNLIAMPILVAAGTVMVVRSEATAKLL